MRQIICWFLGHKQWRLFPEPGLVEEENFIKWDRPDKGIGVKANLCSRCHMVYWEEFHFKPKKSEAKAEGDSCMANVYVPDEARLGS